MPPERDAAPSWRHRLAHLPLQALLFVIERLPWRVARALAGALGGLMHALLRGRVRIAREQMAAALGGDASSPEVARAVRSAFRHFARVPLLLVELPARLRGRRPEELLVLENRERLDAALAKGRGAVFVTAHLGNWEVLGALAPALGVPILSVARPVDNPLLDAEMLRVRGRYGQRITEKNRAGLPIARQLEAGGSVALLIDQHAGARGVRVPFFHADASTFTFAAEVARRFDAAYVPVFSRVDGDDVVHVRFGTEVACDRSLPEDEDAWRMTLDFHRQLEAAIRAQPDQYFWFHRRWKKGGREPDPGWRARYARKE